MFFLIKFPGDEQPNSYTQERAESSVPSWDPSFFLYKSEVLGVEQDPWFENLLPRAKAPSSFLDLQESYGKQALV